MAPRGLPGIQWGPEGKNLYWIARHNGEPHIMLQGVAADTAVAVVSLKQLSSLAEEKTKAAIPLGAFIQWQLTKDGQVALQYDRHQLTWNLNPPELDSVFTFPEGASEITSASPKGPFAFVKDFDVYVLSGEKETPTRVTFGGNKDLTHGVSVSRVEFGITNGLWWSADGGRLAFYREDFRPIEEYPFVNSVVRPAQLVASRYPMAGRAGSIVSVGVFDLHQGTVAWLETDQTKDEYLTNVAFAPDGKRVVVAHVNRLQNQMDLISYDALTGRRQKVLFTENDEEWIEPESPPLFLPNASGEFLWFSYRNGFRNLHLYSAEGTWLRAVTSHKFDVSEFLGFSPEGKSFLYSATGERPIDRHGYRGFVSGIAHTVLTKEQGHHSLNVSPSHEYFVDEHTSLSVPLSLELRSADNGELVRKILDAPNPLANVEMGEEHLFTVKNREGADLYVYMVVPPHREPGKKYPVLQYVYGGPHSQLVTDRWLAGGGRWNLWCHYMATRGYVVFFADGRGTQHRGIEWQQAIHRHMGTKEIEDQVSVLTHVLSEPFADAARVGVTGWSYGGFMTLPLMTREGQRYQGGVAGAPVTDWSYYETRYGERYMDLPGENEEGYEIANPANHVDGLVGRLLVVHGTADDTVVPQNSLAFLRKCIDKGKEVESMVYPGQKHGLTGKDFEHFLRKMTNFFDRYVRDHSAETPDR
jgi:dipeptidyl aminopeptidase/acylaminoacyl peptidase